MTINNDLSKNDRIRKEYLRLRNIYKKFASPDKLKSIDGLMHRASYLRITLEDMECDLDDNGFVEMFSQSDNQVPYERERPTARLFNTLTKNYQTAMTQLNKVIPVETPAEEDDGFEAFLLRREVE